MPNLFAYFMLAIWPLVVIIMFRRMPIERALIWSVLGGYLVLPPVAAIDLPVVPEMNKHAIPALSAFACALVMYGPRGFLPDSRLAKLLLSAFVLSPFITVLTNQEPIIFDVGALPGLRLYDAFAACSYQVIAILPFILGRRILATPEALRELVMALAVAGIVYSVPMLFEVRMSPQLNVMIYGFFQHSFEQAMRSDGFRPFVFLEHGLWVALFALFALLATAALFRHSEPAKRIRWLLAILYTGVILILCKSAGVLVYAFCLLPLILFVGPKLQIRIAALLAILVIAYPILRGADFVPVNAMLAQAERFDPDRAQSLGFRFEHEAALLERAREKPVFGWGMWGRNLIFDPDTGRSQSVTDGRWIIVIGVLGWLGYIGEFGLLGLPLLSLARRSRAILPGSVAVYAGPLALILACNMVDLLPNATLIPFTWLVAGAMLGYAESLRVKRPEGQDVARKPAPVKMPRGREAAAAGPRRSPSRPEPGMTPDRRSK